MKLFLLGFTAALLLLGIAGVTVIKLGLVPVATASAPLPFEQMIAHAALHARVNKEAPKSSPMGPSDKVYLAGAQVYRSNCAVCHGLPDQELSVIARGEFPPPPDFFMDAGVADDPVGVTYWKVSHGIRLTGMPGFVGLLSTEQMWQVSLLLANANKLPPAVHAVLQKPQPPME